MRKNIFVSVVVVGHNRAHLLSSMFASLQAHVKLKDYEIILVVNGASAPIEAVAKRFGSTLPLKLVRIAEQRPGAARNHACQIAKGEVILFLDDDITVQSDIVSATHEIFQQDAKLQVAGGANLTPTNSSSFAHLSGWALGQFWATASMAKRYRSLTSLNATEHDLMLCNLAIRRSAFQQFFFVHGLTSNEENLLLQKLSQAGVKMIRHPALDVFHVRRDDLHGFAAQLLKYGRGRMQNLLYFPQSVRVLYFLPFLFAVYLIGFFFFYGQFWYALPLIVYFLISTAICLPYMLQKRLFLPWVPLIFCFIHVFYALGFTYAFLAWPVEKTTIYEHAHS